MRTLVVAVVVVLGGLMAGRAAADGGAIVGSIGAPPLTQLYSTAESSAIDSGPVIVASADPHRSVVAYGTADGHVHLRRVIGGDVVGPADGIALGGIEGGLAVSLAREVLVLHDAGGQLALAQIDALNGTLVADTAVPGTTGLSLQAPPAAIPGCTAQGVHGAPFTDALLFASGDRLFSVSNPDYPPAAGSITSVQIAGLNDQASPAATGCRTAVVSRAGGFSAVTSGDPMTARDIPLDAGMTPSTPTVAGGRVVAAESDGATTTVAAFDLTAPSAVWRSTALPGTPAPGLTAFTSTNAGPSAVVVATSANLYVLDAGLVELQRLSADPLPAGDGFDAAAPLMTVGSFDRGWTAADPDDRIYAQRDDGSAVVLDANAAPLPAAQFAPPSGLGDPAAASGPVYAQGTAVFAGTQRISAFSDHDDDAPLGSVYVSSPSRPLQGTVSVGLSSTVERQLMSAVFRARPAGGGTPIVIGAASVDAEGGPWEAAFPPYYSDLQPVPREVQWDTRTVPNGDYSFDAVLTDAAGNVAVADGPALTIGNPPVSTRPSAPALKKGGCANSQRGTSKGQRIVGTAAGDSIRGFGGNDSISGGAGVDCLQGNNGNDRLHGDAGNDILDGGAGNDRLDGGTGADVLRGGSGNDVIDARDHSHDVIDCGPGRDTVRADRLDKVARDCEHVTRG